VYAWLSHYGAALYGSTSVNPSTVPEPETVLAEGLKLSRQSASVARALPLAPWKNRRRFDMDRLRREPNAAVRRACWVLPRSDNEALGRNHVRGRSGEVARPISREADAVLPADHLAGTKAGRTAYAEVARKWRFRMNIPMDSFVSMFEKGVQ